MKELEEHLRTMTEQVKIRRRLVIENKKSVKNPFLTEFESFSIDLFHRHRRWK